MRITGPMWFGLAMGIGALNLLALAWAVHRLRVTVRETARHHATALAAQITALRETLERDGLAGWTAAMRAAVGNLERVDGTLTDCAAGLSGLARSLSARADLPPSQETETRA